MRLNHAFVSAVLFTLLFAGTSSPATEIPWYTIDCGGAESIGGSYELVGTIGQHDAPSMSAPMTGGSYELVGGFWGGVSASTSTTGDLDGDGDVDVADFGLFAQCFGGAFNPPAVTCPLGVDADFDNDGDVDVTDFALLAQNFTGPM